MPKRPAVNVSNSILEARERSPGDRPSTPDKILAAARRVLATIGYARLTMRAVAAEAGIAVGNLAYHFPSKTLLVRELIRSLVTDYQAKSNEYLRTAGHDPEAGFQGLMKWLIADSVSRETSRLFREFWVMALHDEVIAKAMNDFYAQAHATIARLLRLSNPGLDPRAAHDIVQLMGAVSEGTNVLYGTASDAGSRASLRRVSKLAGELLGRAAEQAASAPRKKGPGG